MHQKHSQRRVDRDRELQRRIQSFLANRYFPGLRRLDVKVEDGVVVVSGRVHTFHEKQVATACCQRVAGVLQVLNQISVSEIPLVDEYAHGDFSDDPDQEDPLLPGHTRREAVEQSDMGIPW